MPTANCTNFKSSSNRGQNNRAQFSNWLKTKFRYVISSISYYTEVVKLHCFAVRAGFVFHRKTVRVCTYIYCTYNAPHVALYDIVGAESERQNCRPWKKILLNCWIVFCYSIQCISQFSYMSTWPLCKLLKVISTARKSSDFINIH
jgi:hypothetical protein